MDKKKVVRSSDIKITVGLNEDKYPVKLDLVSDDDPTGNGSANCKAMLLSVFDKNTKETLKIDLWTPEMQIMEMDKFFYQTFRALVDTYNRATNNTQLANEMQKFVQYFGEKTEVIPPKKS